MSKSMLSNEIANYIEGRAQVRLEKIDKEADRQRKDLAGNPVALADLENTLAQQRFDEVSRYKPATWLADAANRAKQISMVTHALKYTHSDAKGTSIYAQSAAVKNPLDEKYLTTSSLSVLQIDVVGNAAALDVAGLLQQDADGISLIGAIEKNDFSALKPFVENEEQLLEWVNGFKAAIADKELSSHKLAKQLYFPVGEKSYHLVSPLYASSLTHALYERITESRFGEAAKAIKKAKKEERYNSAVTVDYLNVAVQTFGGSNQQNVSQLNKKRFGKSYLLSCQPPVWSSRELPPSNHTDAFWFEYERRAWRIAKALKVFLLSVTDKGSNVRIRDARAQLVDELIGVLLQYAAEVQSMKEHAGWSAKSKLPLAEQLWLDPFRIDENFQEQREAGNWQEEIAGRFSLWLNHKLKDDKLVFNDVEYREWLTECLKEMS